jgi:hypothetical protein
MVSVFISASELTRLAVAKSPIVGFRSGKNVEIAERRTCTLNDSDVTISTLPGVWRLLANFKGSGLVDNQKPSVPGPHHPPGLPSRAEATPPVAHLRVTDVLKDCADALFLAAKETKEEADGLSRNLLAALNRAAGHVEFFLRLTNSRLVVMHGSEKLLAEIEALRCDAAVRLQEIASILQCPCGFVTPEHLDASESECKAWLGAAAPRIHELGRAFESTRADMLIRLPAIGSAASVSADPLVTTDGSGAYSH